MKANMDTTVARVLKLEQENASLAAQLEELKSETAEWIDGLQDEDMRRAARLDVLEGDQEVAVRDDPLDAGNIIIEVSECAYIRLADTLDALDEAVKTPLTELTLWCDGGLRGPNPGSDLYGSYAYGEIKKTVDFGLTGTNNEAEYMALIAGLLSIAETHNPSTIILTVKIDSDLVRHQVNGEWKVKAEHLRPLRDKARQKLNVFHSWRIHHVPRENVVTMLGH